MKRILDLRLLADRRRTLFGAVVVLAALALIVVPGLASDGPAGEPTTTHAVQPKFKLGNPTLCQFSPGAPESFRINAPSSGTFTDPDNPSFSITLTIPSANPPATPNHQGPSFDFVASGGVVEGMNVKGGPDANFYDYEGTVGPVTDDTYLHSPVNTKNDKYYGLSHIDVCYNPTLTKSGTKFHDRNADGDRDTGEEGLSGWEIRAYADDGDSILEQAEFDAGPAATDMTDSNGDYSMQLTVGDYVIVEVLMNDWFQSAPATSVLAAALDTSAEGIALGEFGYGISLTADDAGNDFGNFQQGTKSGVKFDDLNANGVKDSGEPGLPGWQIHLFGTDGMGDSVHEHATTGAGGSYSFSVKPGSYTVCEELKADWFQSFPTSGADCSGHTHLGNPGALGYTFVPESGDVENTNHFGNYQNATKSGYKYHDLNANGVRDEGDPGLNGWTINVFESDGVTLVASQTTHDGPVGDPGFYEFSLTPGDYEVAEDCTGQTGTWFQSDPGSTNACGGNRYVITLQSGGQDLDNDFGNFQNATKSGVKYHDLNANGQRDGGEPGLGNWTINISGTAGDGSSVSDSTTTGSDGAYSFSVPPGEYDVEEVCPSGWRQSDPGPTTSEADCGDNIHHITLSSGEADEDNHFGNFQNATKSGVKYHDLNANGQRDDGEPGLGNWTINISGTAGDGSSVSDSTTTGSDGAYRFGVPPGEYDVEEVCPSGWRQSDPGPTTSEADCGDNIHHITLSSGEADEDNHFGNFQNATTAGFKFKDADNSGTFNTGDTGLNDWTIFIYSDENGDGMLDSGDIQAGTDMTANNPETADAGYYEFSGLMPGKYIVCEVGQSNWLQTAPANEVCDDDFESLGLAEGGHTITLTSGLLDLNNDFLNTPLSDFDVNFFDLTGSTNATISCQDSGSNSVGSIEIDDESASPETVLEATNLVIGTYMCTIEITDP